MTTRSPRLDPSLTVLPATMRSRSSHDPLSHMTRSGWVSRPRRPRSWGWWCRTRGSTGTAAPWGRAARPRPAAARHGTRHAAAPRRWGDLLESREQADRERVADEEQPVRGSRTAPPTGAPTAGAACGGACWGSPEALTTCVAPCRYAGSGAAPAVATIDRHAGARRTRLGSRPEAGAGTGVPPGWGARSGSRTASRSRRVSPRRSSGQLPAGRGRCGRVSR